jgi:serine protease Do
MNRILKPALVIMAAALVLSASLGAGPAGPDPQDKDISNIARKVYPSVVRVEARNHTRRVATGVVIDKDGHVVTTALISPRDETITITTSEGKRIEADFLGFDTETQLAVVKAKEKGLTPLVMGDAGDLGPGSWICLVGISPERTAAVTQGIVNSLSEMRMRLNIWVTPGSSGGPVVDEKGRMVGLLRGVYTEETPLVFRFRDREQTGTGMVLSSGDAAASGMALAVPVDIVKFVSDEIIDKGKVERGWLGVVIGMDDEGRVVLSEVDPDSPAEEVKLRVGDIVLEIDGETVTTSAMLASGIRRMKPGRDVELKIERDGKAETVKVKLGEYPEDEARRELELRFPRLFPPGAPDAPPRIFPEPPIRVPRPETAPRLPGLVYEQRKFIGVYCDELSRELAQHFGVPEGTGLIVSRLSEGEPAEKAGLEVGDVIVRADGRRVESVEQLIDIIQDHEKGDKIKVEFLRDKKSRSVEVEVAEDSVADFAGPEGVDSFLRAWQGSSDAFRRELGKWGPEIRDDIEVLIGELAKNSKDAFGDLRISLRKALRKI